MVLTVGAALLVFTPKNINLPFETIASNTNPEPDIIITPSSYIPPDYEPVSVVSEQPSTIDAVDLVRSPGGVPGLVTTTEGAKSQGNETGRGTEIVINVTQPTTVAVPSTPPAGRAANGAAPSTSTPSTSSPSTSTVARPAQTTTTPSTSTSTASATPTQTAPSASQTASKPSTASTPAKTTTTPAQTASRPAQTTPVQTTPVALSQPAAQTKVNNDFWVQTGAFSTIASAEGVKQTLASKGITSIIENGNIDGRTLFRVRVGPYTTRNEANYWLALIKSMDGFEDSQVRTTESLR